MKKLFLFGCIGLMLFEFSNVYFIMPMPGSQQWNTLPLAYFLHSNRWVFRILLSIPLIVGLIKGRWTKKFHVVLPLLLLSAIVFVIQNIMAADAMFKQPKSIFLSQASKNKVDKNRLVIGVTMGNISKAYPIQFLGYHHFVYDTLGGQEILVTYCTVCRTGRVYSPIVDGKKQDFRLVGMDHFNAMIEDKTTHSWWQQATGEAVAGPLKGKQLSEIPSFQTSLATWIQQYPNTWIMQPDLEFKDHYDTLFRYENGKSRKSLTGTNPQSGTPKSWVVGLKRNGTTAYIDWNELKRKRIVQTTMDQMPVFVVISKDNKSFFAFENPYASAPECINNIIRIKANSNPSERKDPYENIHTYQLNGQGINHQERLKPVRAYQEFLHSWKQFSQP